jgi:hypothetical protein
MFIDAVEIGEKQAGRLQRFDDPGTPEKCDISPARDKQAADETADAAGARNDDPRMLSEPSRRRRHQPTALAAARPAMRPENRQPPRNVPSSAR